MQRAMKFCSALARTSSPVPPTRSQLPFLPEAGNRSGVVHMLILQMKELRQDSGSLFAIYEAALMSQASLATQPRLFPPLVTLDSSGSP